MKFLIESALWNNPEDLREKYPVLLEKFSLSTGTLSGETHFTWRGTELSHTWKRKVVYIELNTLEELMRLQDAVGKSLIICQTDEEHEGHEYIIIHDGCVE